MLQYGFFTDLFTTSPIALGIVPNHAILVYPIGVVSVVGTVACMAGGKFGPAGVAVAASISLVVVREFAFTLGECMVFCRIWLVIFFVSGRTFSGFLVFFTT